MGGLIVSGINEECVRRPYGAAALLSLDAAPDQRRGSPYGAVIPGLTRDPLAPEASLG